MNFAIIDEKRVEYLSYVQIVGSSVGHKYFIAQCEYAIFQHFFSTLFKCGWTENFGLHDDLLKDWCGFDSSACDDQSILPSLGIFYFQPYI